ncbi:MAG: TorD/DmsD family molecular chaperone [Candidatus Acidulodesulfobacterium sp.]
MDFDNIITEGKIDLETFGKLSSYRNMMYNFFSRVFARKVDLKFLESLTHEEIESVIGGLCEDDQSAKDLVVSVKETLSSKKNLEIKEREFDELFVIPSPGRFIPPYMSYYFGGGSQKADFEDGGKSGNEGDLSLVNKLEITYKSLNFELKDPNGVSIKRPDHISYILGFIAALINLEDRYLTGQVKEPLPFNEVVANEFMFFSEFVGNWIGLFADEVIKRSGSMFYAPAAKLLQGFIVCEQRDYNNIVTKI